MTVLATAHAATARATAGFLSWVFILGVGYAILTLFVRRIGGKGGGSEKRIVGVGTFLAAVIVGLLVATRRWTSRARTFRIPDQGDSRSLVLYRR